MRIIRDIAILVVVVCFCGCQSTPPPPPKSVQMVMAENYVQTANDTGAARNWKASASAWGNAATQYALLDMREAQANALHNQATMLLFYYRWLAGSTNEDERQSMTLDIPLQVALRALDIHHFCKSAEIWKDLLLLAKIERDMDIEKAQRRMEEVLSLAEELDFRTNNPEALVSIFNEQAVVLLKSGNASDAKAKLVEALSLSGSAECRVNLAFCAEQMGEENALQLWQSCLESAKASESLEGIAVSLEGIGRCYEKRGDVDMAERYLTFALENYNQLRMRFEAKRVSERLENRNKQSE